MAIYYPADLPLPLATKRASAVPAFGMAQPRRGTPFTEPRATVPPTIYEVEWLLQAHEAPVFRDWVYVTLKQGSLAFYMPLRTEYGLQVLPCIFSPDGLLDRQRIGALWRYRATIISSESLIMPPTAISPAAPGVGDASGLRATIATSDAPRDSLYGFVTHLYTFDNAETVGGPFVNSIAGGSAATRSGGVAAQLPTANLVAGSVRAIRAQAPAPGDGLQLNIARSATDQRQPWCIDAQIRRLADAVSEGDWQNGGVLQFTNFAFFVRGTGADGGAGPTGTAWQARFSVNGVVQSRGTKVLQVGQKWHIALSWSPVGTTQGRWRCFIDGELEFDITLTGNNLIGAQTTVRIGPTSGTTSFGTLPFELDLWRLTIGDARYTAPFTPPDNAANYLPPL